jgi:enoyl-CoA hydratase
VGDAQSVVLYQVEDRIATVTLNRPGARNALSRALTHALWDAVMAAGEARDVDAVILTGADPAFCAGVDLKEMSGESPPSAAPRPPGEGPGRDSGGLFRFLPVIAKPVIGAINGAAITGGLEVALQCTFLVASDRAVFADTHARVGVMPGGGMTVLLAQSIGLRRAIEMSLTGNFVTAAEALRLGLVNHVVPHAELLPFARRVAADIVSNDQRAVARLLQHYRQVAGATLGEAHLLEGFMAETWQHPASQVAARRAEVTARGRDGLRGGRDGRINT